jgi:hypothetical protein
MPEEVQEIPQEVQQIPEGNVKGSVDGKKGVKRVMSDSQKESLKLAREKLLYIVSN